MLGGNGHGHEPTASVSVMATEAMEAMEATTTTTTTRIARACRRLAVINNAVTGSLCTSLVEHYGPVTAKTGPFQNRHRVRPNTLPATG